MKLGNALMLLLMQLFAEEYVESYYSNLHDRNPTCYVVPKLDVCKKSSIQWNEDYGWRAYYNWQGNECFYYRGCPRTGKELSTYNKACRAACVRRGSLPKELDRPAMCLEKPEKSKCTVLHKMGTFPDVIPLHAISRTGKRLSAVKSAKALAEDTGEIKLYALFRALIKGKKRDKDLTAERKELIVKLIV